MGVYFYSGGVLFDTGAVAFDEACCCNNPVYCENCSVLDSSSRPTITVNGLINGNHGGLPPTTCYDCSFDCRSMDGVPVATTSFGTSCTTGGHSGTCIWTTDTFNVTCFWYSSCTGTQSQASLKYSICIALDEANNLCLMGGSIFYPPGGAGLLASFSASVSADDGFISSPVTLSYVGKTAGLCDLSASPTMVVEW